MKRITLTLSLVSLSACATSSLSASGAPQPVGGENGDLRVLLAPACPGMKELETQWARYTEMADRTAGHEFSSKSAGSGGSGGIAVELLSGFSSLVVKSFGEFLRDAGAERATQSSAMTGGYFFTAAGNETVSITPHMRCIYLVRNGFALKPGRFAPGIPEDLRRTWTELGLTRTPDLFASLHLETTADAELSAQLPAWLELSRAMAEGVQTRRPALSISSPAPYFRAKLDRLYIQEFQQPQGASDYRDLVIALNYASAGQSSRNLPEGSAVASAGASADRGNLFAAGGIRLSGARRGDYREGLLSSLTTGWMAMPGGGNQRGDDPRVTTNLSVHLVEASPGNSLFQALGSYLAGEQVAQAVSSATRPQGGN